MMRRICFESISKINLLTALCIVSLVCLISFNKYYKDPNRRKTLELPSHAVKFKMPFMTSTGGQVQKQGDPAPVDENSMAGDQGVPQWMSAALAALNNPNDPSRLSIVRDLEKHPSPEAIDLLRKFLKDQDGVIVFTAIDILGAIGLKAPHLSDMVLDVLSQRAKDKEFGYRYNALTMAAAIGKEDVLPIVSEFVAEEDESAKECAARALSLISSPACVPLLEKLLSEEVKDPDTRQVVFETLAAINTPEALALVEESAIFSTGPERAASIRALSRLNRPEINDILSAQLRNETMDDATYEVLATSPAAPEIFGEALRVTPENTDRVWLLQQIAKYAPSANAEVRAELTDTIKPFLNSKDTEIQEKAINAVAQLGSDEAPDILKDQLDADDSKIRIEALRALAPYANPDTYKDLLPMIWDEDQMTRRTALMIAEPFINESDRTVLEKAKNHPDPAIKEQVGTILKLLDIDKVWEQGGDFTKPLS